MTWTVWAAIVIVILTVAALIKRYETRLVLLASGFLMTCLSLDPMQGLNAFAKSMTNSGLIMAICSAMGFAFVVQMTKCDSFSGRVRGGRGSDNDSLITPSRR